MAVWVIDVRFAPIPIAPEPATFGHCADGTSAPAPADADLEVVVCASRTQ